MLVNFLLAIFLEFDFRFVRKQVSLEVFEGQEA